MLSFGWITPTGYQFPAGSIEANFHSDVVKKFIRGLRFYDLELSLALQNKVRGAGRYSYEQIGIITLGWVKVGAINQKIITLADYSFQNRYKLMYTVNGYHIDSLHLNDEEDEYIAINCNNEQEIVDNGDNRYATDNMPFKYNGTDEYDYYITKDGETKFPPWNKKKIAF